MRYTYLLISLLILSCQSGQDTEHAHDDGSVHSHTSEEKPTLDFTTWTDKTELFVEFPVLIVGQTSRFAAHFTVLEGHQPIREGSVTASLIKGNKGIRHTVDAPSSPGIFTPSLQPKEEGMYQLVFDVTTPDYTDRIVLENIRVYSKLEEALQDVDEEDSGNVISFLKEQAWKMEFQTHRVSKKQMYQNITTSGVWKVSPSDYEVVIAPANGKVQFPKGNILTPGSGVQKGQILMSISSSGLSSNNIAAEIQKAKALFEQANSEFKRKKELYEAKIIAKAEFESVEQKYLVAKTNYETLSSGFEEGGKSIVSPINGFVKTIMAENGAFVEVGSPLLSVTSHQSSLLEIRVHPKWSEQLQNIQDVWFQTHHETWERLSETGGTILSVGKEVESNQPLLSIFVQVEAEIAMPEGSFTEVQLSVGKPNPSLVIPLESLLEDYGNYYVIVQLYGESFERRNVKIGQKNGSEVAVLDGLEDGEVVVSKGAYQVKMASMAGQAPAHGHAH